MNRVKIAMVVIGFVLIFFGYQEFRVSSNSTSEAEKIELSSLEQSDKPKNNHLEIGRHIKFFPGLIYQYSTYSSSDQEIDKELPAHTSIDYSYYPIISETHPASEGVKAYKELHEMHMEGKLNDDFDSEAIQKILSESKVDFDKLMKEGPVIKDFKVLVKTNNYYTVGNLPQTDIAIGESIKGMVINSITSLDNDEIKLLRESFPNANLDNVLILEENRSPSSALLFIGLWVAGVILIVVGFVLKKKEPKYY